VELQHTSIQPNVFRSTYSEEIRRRIEMFNLLSLYRQNWIRDITQQRLTQTDTFNLRRATTEAEQQTSRLPPSYDDVIRQSSITTPMEQQSLLLPS
jgi:hypothetical protein